MPKYKCCNCFYEHEVDTQCPQAITAENIRFNLLLSELAKMNDWLKAIWQNQ